MNELYIKHLTINTFLTLLQTTSLNKISVKLICQEASISRTSFYNNFESKEDLTYKAELALFKKILVPISTPPKISIDCNNNIAFDYANFKTQIDSFVNLLYIHRFEFSALYGENGDPNFYKNFQEELDYLWKYNDLIELNENFIPKQYAHSIRNALFVSIFTTWIEEDFKSSPLEISTMFSDVNFRLNKMIIDGPLNI